MLHSVCVETVCWNGEYHPPLINPGTSGGGIYGYNTKPPRILLYQIAPNDAVEGEGICGTTTLHQEAMRRPASTRHTDVSGIDICIAMAWLGYQSLF